MGDDVRMVVFDLGGVVVRICRSVQEAGRRAGVDIPDSEMTETKRAGRRAIHAEYERGRMTCGEFFAAIAGTTGGLVSAERFRAIHGAWLIDEYPGVGVLIDELHARGIGTGVLSNTNASHWGQMTDGAPALARFPTIARVQHPHASHLLGHAKPDAAIYREFERRTRVPGGAIVFFDDLPENVAAARAAGWTAHRVDHEGDTAAQMRDFLSEHVHPAW